MTRPTTRDEHFQQQTEVLKKLKQALRMAMNTYTKYPGAKNYRAMESAMLAYQGYWQELYLKK